jgi:hypothetical protein
MTLSAYAHVNTFTVAISAFAAALALASPCQAKIVYHSADIVINNGTYNLDQNGITYFTIASEYSGSCEPFSTRRGELSETAASGSGAIAGPLTTGDEIGPNQAFSGGMVDMESFVGRGNDLGHCAIGSWTGTWCSPGASYCSEVTGYLGLSFQINGETHYGWAELSIPESSTSVRLKGVAFETTPGLAIQAGQTQ